MSKSFEWGNLGLRFISAIVYSSSTKHKPITTVEDINLLIPYMDSISYGPNIAFAKTYRREIEDYFLKGSPYLVEIINNMKRRNIKGLDLSSMDSMLESLKKKKCTETLLRLYVKALYKAGCCFVPDGEDEFLYTRHCRVDLEKSEDGDYALFDYQEKALHAMHKYYIVEDKRAGILMMPTGSGKTRVVTRFIFEDMISSGYQVVFLTHRALLIEQAGGSIYTACPILKHIVPDKKEFNMICISGKHASIKQASVTDDVIVLSVQTAIRNIDYLKAIVSDKVFIVCDEMHHSIAPSFAVTIKEISRIAKKSKLLGLSATPVRANEKDSLKLMKMYDNTIIHKIDATELITKGYLSTPIVEQVDTNIDMQTHITLDEQKYIEKWGEISPELLEKMANIKERNAVIVDQYINNQDQYGKTLIFALNAHHCISLCEALQEQGVKCDYIYCAHPGNDTKIQKFKNGELDVLVNINVLSEGSDIPDIQTVFLTRPTQSDVLLMQMCGRGLRGKSCGGTETVNIVDFHDMWGRARIWLTADMFFNSNTEILEEITENTSYYKKTELIEWAMIRDLLEGIQTSIYPGEGLLSEVILPSGWYDVITQDGSDTKVLFFASQLEGYKKLWENKNRFMNNQHYSGDDALFDFFSGIGLMPTSYELELVINTARLLGEMIHPHVLESRKSVDASALAEMIMENNVGYKDIAKITREKYDERKELVDSLYGGYESYYNRVLDFLRYPNGIKPLGTKVEEMEIEILEYDYSRGYDLSKLVCEVIDERFEGEYGFLPKVIWTEGRPSMYYGQYNYCQDRSKDFIKINSVLNSRSVEKEAIKYIIYHELLHRDNKYHNNAFYEKEHLYPKWEEQEIYLARTFPKFDINYSL